MRLNVLLVIAAVIAGVFGVGFVVASGPLLSVYGVTLDKAGTLVAQLFGASLIGIAVLNWLARNVTDPDARQAVVFANLTQDVGPLSVTHQGQLPSVTISFNTRPGVAL